VAQPFVDSRSWYRAEPALAAQRTLVLVDGPSHGGSQPAQQRFALDDCAVAAGEILDQLGMTAPVDWVGSAWGGHVGWVLAASQPGRIRALVTMASPVSALTTAERRRIGPLVVLYGLPLDHTARRNQCHPRNCSPPRRSSPTRRSC
jgi:pimeloyl-ACP methyl ester carboxylesterase